MILHNYLKNLPLKYLAVCYTNNFKKICLRDIKYIKK